MSDRIVSDAKYVVQKYQLLREAELKAGGEHVTQCSLASDQRALRHAQTMLNAALTELEESVNGAEP